MEFGTVRISRTNPTCATLLFYVPRVYVTNQNTNFPPSQLIFTMTDAAETNGEAYVPKNIMVTGGAGT